MKRYSLEEDRPGWGVAYKSGLVVYPEHTTPLEWLQDGRDIFAISADLESFDVM